MKVDHKILDPIKKDFEAYGKLNLHDFFCLLELADDDMLAMGDALGTSELAANIRKLLGVDA